jgi:hypothetical protein
VASKCAFWNVAELFINGTEICSPSSVEGREDQRDLCVVLWNMHGGGVNKLETGVQLLELFQGADLVLLTETSHFPGQHCHTLKGLTHLR